ncbi:universal stress protein [Streptomyces nojiriensis]|uniref:universal stress protein n=1 Tax=Streptomyces nojiriensis TaxID=66374 RepID=UPI002E189CAE
MELPLTVGLDGSGSSLEALDWAVDEAALHRRPLRVVYASRWERYEPQAPGQDRSAGQVVGRDVVEVAARRAERRNPDLTVDTEVLADDPVHALLQESRTSWALVTGSRGRGEIAEFLLGSVSLSVAARALCPVIGVRGDEPGLHGTHDRSLLGVADTPGGQEAVRFALREAATRDCELHAVHTWRCPAPEAVDHPSLPDGTCVYHQARADTLLDEALTGPLREHPPVRLRGALPGAQASAPDTAWFHARRPTGGDRSAHAARLAAEAAWMVRDHGSAMRPLGREGAMTE